MRRRLPALLPILIAASLAGAAGCERVVVPLRERLTGEVVQVPDPIPPGFHEQMNEAIELPDADLAKAAAAGTPGAAFIYAHRLITRGASGAELAAAKAHLEQLAAAGVPRPASFYAQELREGGHFPRDDARAFALALVAANGGDADAFMPVARAYDQGVGIARDRQEALKWYLLAACTDDEPVDEVAALRKALPAQAQADAEYDALYWKAARPWARHVRVVQPHEAMMRASGLPARPFELEKGDPGQVYATKIGGAPWWPAGKARPRCAKGHPMMFVAQVLLADVPGFRSWDRALLSFHYCDRDGWPEARGKDYDVRLFPHGWARPDGLGTVADGPGLAGLPRFSAVEDFRSIADVWEMPHGSASFNGAAASLVDVHAYPGRPKEFLEELPHAYGHKLGGWPTWEQSAGWPTCDHGRRMRFVAQIDGLGGQVLWSGGGYAYLFACPAACRGRHAEMTVQTS